MTTTMPQAPDPFDPPPEQEPDAPVEPTSPPVEVPFPEPKHYPIHREIPVQPIH